MHVDQEPVGVRCTHWLALCVVGIRYAEGWVAMRTARVAPGAWPGVAGGCCVAGARRRARGALARLVSWGAGAGARARLPWCIGGVGAGWRHRTALVTEQRCAWHQRMPSTPQPAMVAPAGPFMPPQTAPRSPACLVRACTESCARCQAIGHP